LETKSLESDKPLFDTVRTFTVPLIDGRKVEVHYPSDKQLDRLKQATKVLIKDLGRGKQETTTSKQEGFDGKLLNEIREPGPDVDEAEATYIIDVVTQSVVIDIKREGPAYRVFLSVPGDVVTEHALRLPTQGQIVDHRRASAKFISLPLGMREFRVNYGHAAHLYDELCEETSGYADGTKVPLNHKSAVIDATFDQIERDLAVAASEDF
jgi:hypothetical protein